MQSFLARRRRKESLRKSREQKRNCGETELQTCSPSLLRWPVPLLGTEFAEKGKRRKYRSTGRKIWARKIEVKFLKKFPGPLNFSKSCTASWSTPKEGMTTEYKYESLYGANSLSSDERMNMTVVDSERPRIKELLASGPRACATRKESLWKGSLLMAVLAIFAIALFGVYKYKPQESHTMYEAPVPVELDMKVVNTGKVKVEPAVDGMMGTTGKSDGMSGGENPKTTTTTPEAVCPGSCQMQIDDNANAIQALNSTIAAYAANILTQSGWMLGVPIDQSRALTGDNSLTPCNVVCKYNGRTCSQPRLRAVNDQATFEYALALANNNVLNFYPVPRRKCNSFSNGTFFNSPPFVSLNAINQSTTESYLKGYDPRPCFYSGGASTCSSLTDVSQRLCCCVAAGEDPATVCPVA
eukprot:g77719.t1